MGRCSKKDALHPLADWGRVGLAGSEYQTKGQTKRNPPCNAWNTMNQKNGSGILSSWGPGKLKKKKGDRGKDTHPQATTDEARGWTIPSQVLADQKTSGWMEGETPLFRKQTRTFAARPKPLHIEIDHLGVPLSIRSDLLDPSRRGDRTQICARAGDGHAPRQLFGLQQQGAYRVALHLHVGRQQQNLGSNKHAVFESAAAKTANAAAARESDSKNMACAAASSTLASFFFFDTPPPCPTATTKTACVFLLNRACASRSFSFWIDARLSLIEGLDRNPFHDRGASRTRRFVDKPACLAVVGHTPQSKKDGRIPS